MVVRRSLSLVLLIASTALAPAIARAAQPRAAELSDAEVSRRAAWIQRRLDGGTASADRWWTVWYAGFTVATVGQAAVATAVSDPGLRADMAVGAVGTSLGVVPLGLFPFEARFAAADLRAVAGSSPAERRSKLDAAERLLERSADAEAFGRSWVAHVLGIGVSLGLGLVLVVGYDRVASGIVNFAGGVAVTELQILTQPTDAIDALREYRAGLRWGPGSVSGRF